MAERVQFVRAGSRPFRLAECPRDDREIDLPHTDGQVLAIVVAPCVVQVEVRNPVAVLADEVGLPCTVVTGSVS